MSKILIILVSMVIILIVLFTQISLFVVQPMGAIPEGKTLVILKLNKTNFIDSADAMCVRETGKLNLICRGMMLSAVIKKGKILTELPYSHFLYKFSTNGKEYSK